MTLTPNKVPHEPFGRPRPKLLLIAVELYRFNLHTLSETPSLRAKQRGGQPPMMSSAYRLRRSLTYTWCIPKSLFKIFRGPEFHKTSVGDESSESWPLIPPMGVSRGGNRRCAGVMICSYFDWFINFIPTIHLIINHLHNHFAQCSLC